MVFNSLYRKKSAAVFIQESEKKKLVLHYVYTTMETFFYCKTGVIEIEVIYCNYFVSWKERFIVLFYTSTQYYKWINGWACLLFLSSPK